jgi:iron complex transport system ATP-binding protein
MNPASKVRLHGLSVALDGTEVLHSVSMDVPAGQWLAVIGPNGAGKSTMLKAIAGLVRYQGGVELDGEPAGQLSPRARARRVAYAPQVPAMPAGMTVVDYVLLGRTPYLGYLAREGRRDREVAASVLERLDLTAVTRRQLGSLSGGEQQRVVLARALAQQADLLLLDEPTTALDIGHQQQVLDLVDRLRLDDGLTVVSSLHDLTVAGQYADELMLLVDGRTVATGKPAEVLTEATVGTHYGATVQVTTGADGRPQVHLVRR